MSRQERRFVSRYYTGCRILNRPGALSNAHLMNGRNGFLLVRKESQEEGLQVEPQLRKRAKR